MKTIFKHLFKTAENEYQLKRYYLEGESNKLLVEITHYKKIYRKGNTYYKKGDQYAVYCTKEEYQLDVFYALQDNTKLAKGLNTAMNISSDVFEDKGA